MGKKCGKERNEDKLSGETIISLYYSDKATVTHAKPIEKRGNSVKSQNSQTFLPFSYFYRSIFVKNLIDFEKSAILMSHIASFAEIFWGIISSFSILY